MKVEKMRYRTEKKEGETGRRRSRARREWRGCG